MTTVYQGDGYRLRLAEPQDSAALCELFRKVHLKSSLDITQERDPDFFAMPRMHLGEFESYVGENEAGLVGASGTVIARPGWLDGQRCTTGYLSDLRILPGFKGARKMPEAYRVCLQRARERWGVEVLYTVIFDNNLLARRALVDRKQKKAGHRQPQPIYRVMTPFLMTSVQLTFRQPKPVHSVVRAQRADLDPLVSFLDQQSQGRTLGEDFSGDLLSRRLATWPGLTLDSFFLAKNSNGDILGCLAPWDPADLKRTRVLGYHGKMAWLKRGYGLLAKLGGFPPFPSAGECFRFPFLSHLEVKNDDPAVLQSLLRATYAALRPEKYHFMSAMIPVGSPLAAAFKGFWVQKTAMTVYSVVLPDSPWAERDFSTLRPGFEMALS